MRIVHCFFTLEMGGAQVLAVDLLNGLCTAHDTALVVVNDIVCQPLLKKLDKRVRVYLINRKEGSRNPLPILKFNLLLLKLKPDVIHLHEPDIGRIIKVKVGKKLYTIHDTGIPTTHYHCFDSLIAISDAVHKDVVHRLNRPVQTVYNGIDTAPFKKRTVYSIQNKGIKLVQLSRLLPQKKGQDILLKALAILRDEYGYTNTTLDFIGVGPSLQHLETEVKELRLKSQVNFIGEKSREWVYEHLANYHLLVQPSLYEGFGLTLLEGFAAGLPVLASNIEGPAEIIGRTPRGFLFEKSNPSHCAQQLRHIIAQYEEGAMAQLMETTVPVTEKQYSILACAKGYLKAYTELCEAKGNSKMG